MQSYSSISPAAVRHRGIRPLPLAIFLLCSLIGLSLMARAATAPTAMIRGTVSNAATSNNLNQASVRVQGQQQEYLTERDGSYAVIGLAPGTYEITVNYVGLDAQ